MINAERRLGKTVPIRAIPTVTRASDLFRRYHREQRQEVRKADVKEDKALAQLKEAWKEFNCRKRRAIVDEYEVAVSIVSSINYSSVDVGKFSIALTEFQEEKDFFSKAGLFLSALINNGKDASYTITTRHLEKPIKYLGFRNTKNITIIGDVGADAAYKMESGVMVINGNTGGGTGYEMQGGSLEINGNAGMRLGTKMKDGTISVKKDVRAAAGLLMQGGAIVINGNANDHLGGLMEGGNIVVKGNAENSVGFEMKGGSIRVKNHVMDFCGKKMRAGKITVGSADNHVGNSMEGGRITAEGRIGNITGEEMTGGVILVEGHAGDYIGFRMIAGKIIVEGYLGDRVGFEMEGGEIHANGDELPSFVRVINGKIFHKGKLIYPRRKFITICM